MVSPPLLPRHLAGERHFRWRGGAVSRLESLSDGVFALAVALLVLGSGDAVAWTDMRRALYSIPVLAVCFAILLWLWGCHFYFHRRFGLEDGTCTFLNVLFLFLVLVYVLPLKYVFGLMLDVSLQLGIGYGDHWPDLAEWRVLMTFYSGWYSALFGVLYLMYRYAWRHRDDLQLDPAERARTRGVMRAHLLALGVGLLSLALVWTVSGLASVILAGSIYSIQGPLMWWQGARTDRAVEREAAGAT